MNRVWASAVLLAAGLTGACSESSSVAVTTRTTTSSTTTAAAPSPTAEPAPAGSSCEAVAAAVSALGVVPDDAALDVAIDTVEQSTPAAATDLQTPMRDLVAALSAQRDADPGTAMLDARRAVIDALDDLNGHCLAAGSTALQ